VLKTIRKKDKQIMVA